MKDYPVLVTPCVGVWIETKAILEKYKGIEVTPCVGVWIETSISRSMESISLSHPAWVCGLKQCVVQVTLSFVQVTPCVGVWIETLLTGK